MHLFLIATFFLLPESTRENISWKLFANIPRLPDSWSILGYFIGETGLNNLVETPDVCVCVCVNVYFCPHSVYLCVSRKKRKKGREQRKRDEQY